MKIYLLLPVLTIVQLYTAFAEAYVLPLETILKKSAALSGNTIVAIEQNVIFREGTVDYVIKEEWLIEGDKNLKLTATGVGELKDVFKLNYLYNNKKRTHIAGKNRVITEASREVIEKFLAVKSIGSYQNYLTELGISNRVRLSRASGTISFAIGDPSTERALSPQFWIDQDFFHLNKIRFPTEAEVEFSDYKTYGKLEYPDLKYVAWADKGAIIKVTRVSTKTGATIKNFYPQTLDQPSEMNLAGKGALGQKIEEFYKRFR